MTTAYEPVTAAYRIDPVRWWAEFFRNTYQQWKHDRLERARWKQTYTEQMAARSKQHLIDTLVLPAMQEGSEAWQNGRYQYLKERATNPHLVEYVGKQ